MTQQWDSRLRGMPCPKPTFFLIVSMSLLRNLFRRTNAAWGRSAGQHRTFSPSMQVTAQKLTLVRGRSLPNPSKSAGHQSSRHFTSGTRRRAE
jgi:hypothetical protein